MQGLRACAPVMQRVGQLGQPYRHRNPGSFRELGDSDDDGDDDNYYGDAMDPYDDDGGLVPMPSNQSNLKFKRQPSKVSTLQLPDDAIPSPTFRRPGEATLDKKKAKQSNKCKCCTKELTKADKDKSLVSKYVKCSNCKFNVCELCRDLEYRCHECYIQKSVKLDPNDLMQLQRETLLRFLEILHYNESDFQHFDKAHLVKQILTRFKLHELWDPRFHADPLEIEELQRKGSMLPQDEPEEYNYKDRKAQPQHTKGRQRARSSDDLLDGNSEIYDQMPRYPPDLESKLAGTLRRYPQEMAPRPMARKEFAGGQVLALRNVSSPKYFEDLSVVELRGILNSYGLDSTGERHDLHFRVLQLWNNEKDKVNQAQSQYSSPVLPNFTVNQRSANLPKTFSLKDIPSSSAIEKLTITQMKTLLRKYNQDVEAFQHRADLEYQVLILWNKAKREALGIQQDQPKPAMVNARVWKSQELGPPGPRRDITLAGAQNPRGGSPVQRNYGNQELGPTGPRRDIPLAGAQNPRGGSPVQRNYGNQQQEDTRSLTSRERYTPMLEQDVKPAYPQQVVQRGAGSYEQGNWYNHSPQNTRREPYGNTSSLPRKNVPLPPPLPPPAPHLLKTLSLHDIHQPEEISALSMRQMLDLLENYSVNTDGANDKAQLEELVKQVWFEEIMPERNKPIQSGPTYRPPHSGQPYGNNSPRGLEDQYATMTVSNKPRYTEPDNLSMTSGGHQRYYNPEPPSNVPYQKPYGQIQPQDKSIGTVKKHSQDVCMVCQNRLVECILHNCGHMVTCLSCAGRIDACPLCHLEIVKIIDIARK